MGEIREGGKREGRKNSVPSMFYSSAAISLNNANSTADFPQRPADPHNTACSLIQSDNPSQVDKGEHVEYVRRLPVHLVRFLEVDSRSAQRKGELGAVVVEREESGRWRDESRIRACAETKP